LFSYLEVVLKKDRLIQLIRLGESDTLEFKRTITHADKIAKTLVSFANYKGGIILVGIDDNGKLLGCNPQAERRTIQLASNYFCEPEVEFFIEEITLESIVILKVTVPESFVKPHFALNNQGEKIPYIRIGDNSTIASRTTLKAISLDRGEQKRKWNSKEAAVLEFLQINKRISALQLASMLNFSIHRSEKFLFDLAMDGVIREHHQGRNVYYTLS